MKTTKLELNATDACSIYRALGREEEAVRGDVTESPAVKAMTLAHIADLKDRVAIVYEKTRTISKAKAKGGVK